MKMRVELFTTRLESQKQTPVMLKCFQAEDLTLEEITQLRHEYKEYKIISL